MSIDFRTNQIRTNKIIASGSTGTNARILVYPVEAALNLQGAINPLQFDTSSIGSDVFFYVSGSEITAKTVFGGATVFSGSASFSNPNSGLYGPSVLIPGSQLRLIGTSPDFGDDVIQIGDRNVQSVKIIATGSYATIAEFTEDSSQLTGIVYFTGGPVYFQAGFGAFAYFGGGLSGSLQRLTDGTPYLVPGPNITITTQSNGAIAISGSSGGTNFDVSLTNSSGGIIAAGQPVYISGVEQVDFSRANASATAIVFGIAVSSFANGAIGSIRYGGSVSIPSTEQIGTWVAGDTIYLYDITKGKLTNAAPSSSTTYVLEVGQITTTPGGGAATLYLMKTSRILVP